MRECLLDIVLRPCARPIYTVLAKPFGKLCVAMQYIDPNYLNRVPVPKLSLEVHTTPSGHALAVRCSAPDGASAVVAWTRELDSDELDLLSVLSVAGGADLFLLGLRSPEISRAAVESPIHSIAPLLHPRGRFAAEIDRRLFEFWRRTERAAQRPR